ncbi:MAG: hypothetical protein L6R35_004418 [Caloplaca aegaea]|nr:MAG: hypothetical protein L6R35_004418 [Caloplaca aegaea]
MNGPIFGSPRNYEAYPNYDPYPDSSPSPQSPRYEPGRKADRVQALRGDRDGYGRAMAKGMGPREGAAYPGAGGVRAKAERMGPLEGAASPGAGWHGPAAREGAVVDFKTDHPPYRYIKDEKYQLIRNIGVGGQGHCDLYQNTRSGKYLVCKIMKAHASDSPSDKPREATILMEILDSNRRIIDLQAYAHSSTRTTFWYEWCPNGDLQDLIDAYTKRRAKIPESFIWHAYMQLADAFAYIHTGYDRTTYDGAPPPKKFQPIVHRDVKPPNIFLRPSGRGGSHPYPDLVLADFGLATTKTRSGEGGLMGTPSWHPPETPLHTPQGDIWSMGACIHVLATGSPPLSSAPRGWKDDDWIEQPQARMVADLKKFGYSKYLDDAMYAAMRTRASQRLMGKELVRAVRDGIKKWYSSGGEDVALASWALKKVE